MAQLLMHCANYGCKKAVRGFVRNDWNIPEGELADTQDTDQHIPPAEQLLRVKNVKEVLDLLSKDRQITIECLKEVDESDLLSIKNNCTLGRSVNDAVSASSDDDRAPQTA